MPIGDDAIAGGMTTVNGATANSAPAIDDYINRAMDYTANGPTHWKSGVTVPLSKGGTGATSAAAARTALGVPATADVVLNTDLAGADSAVAFKVPTYNGSAQLTTVAPSLPGHAVDLATLSAHIGVSASIPIYSPHGRANPATTSYVAGALNGDGRVCVFPSAAKYKRDIEDWNGSVLGFRPVTYILKADERETVRIGIVADEANEIDPRFVVHEDGEVESFKYELLAVGLLRDVQRLAARVSELESMLRGQAS